MKEAGFNPQTGFSIKPGIAPVTKKSPPAAVQGITDEELQRILQEAKARILIVGCGGAGCNTISRIMKVGVAGAETISINTDAQDLLYTASHRKILIGKDTTGGLGAGNNPELGEAAAREDDAVIKEHLYGADMVFVTCGLGGGTGTGAAPVVAEIARKIGALTVGVVTLPFTVEGTRRMKNAERGLEKLKSVADSVIVIPNDKLLQLAPELSLAAAFEVADSVLTDAIKGITELITKPGLVNLDFADVRSVLRDSGIAALGIGESDSPNRAEEAVNDAINSPLLDVDITNAKGALINVVGDPTFTVSEAERIVAKVSEALDPEANVIWGAQIDDALKKTIRVLVILSGVYSPYAVGGTERPVKKIELKDLGLEEL
ncbi:MAG: cell division protein FtsZ [Candidatus Hadarchaeales archaeon]